MLPDLDLQIMQIFQVRGDSKFEFFLHILIGKAELGHKSDSPLKFRFFQVMWLVKGVVHTLSSQKAIFSMEKHGLKKGYFKRNFG